MWIASYKTPQLSPMDSSHPAGIPVSMFELQSN